MNIMSSPSLSLSNGVADLGSNEVIFSDDESDIYEENNGDGSDDDMDVDLNRVPIQYNTASEVKSGNSEDEENEEEDDIDTFEAYSSCYVDGSKELSKDSDERDVEDSVTPANAGSGTPSKSLALSENTMSRGRPHHVQTASPDSDDEGESR